MSEGAVLFHSPCRVGTLSFTQIKTEPSLKIYIFEVYSEKYRK
jgi:hypothetical protein